MNPSVVGLGLLLAACCTTSSCTSVEIGSDYDHTQEAFDQLIVGVTTPEQAIEILDGPPWQVTPFDFDADQQVIAERYVWHHNLTRVFVLDSWHYHNQLSLVFRKDESGVFRLETQPKSAAIDLQ